MFQVFRVLKRWLNPLPLKQQLSTLTIWAFQTPLDELFYRTVVLEKIIWNWVKDNISGRITAGQYFRKNFQKLVAGQNFGKNSQKLKVEQNFEKNWSWGNIGENLPKIGHWTKECTNLNFDLIQWWTEIIMQLRVLPQILSPVLTNIQNAKKKRNKWHKKINFFYIIRNSDAGVPPRYENKCT